tara:strand:- start:720 stop:1574 length:855 start_codon:yes stop_codon:yes gene_type:complete
MSQGPLGLIAGNGALPLQLAAAQVASGGDIFILGLEGEADVGIEAYPHVWSPLGHLKAAADHLLQAGCSQIVILGGIQRPKLETLDYDEGGQWFVEQAMAGEHAGDDQLLKLILAYFQSRGLAIQPAEAVLSDLTGRAGPQTSHPHARHEEDIARASKIAKTIGAQDIGQSVVVAQRLVLGIEGPEGTDALLQRVAGLASEFIGTPDAKIGVLAKLPKPQQDRRVDLPTLGKRTVELAVQAHLAGIVYETGGALFDDFDAMVALAEEQGLFLVGLAPVDVSGEA